MKKRDFTSNCNKNKGIFYEFLFQKKSSCCKIYLILPHSQVVRQCALTARRVSSNLTGAAIFWREL